QAAFCSNGDGGFGVVQGSKKMAHPVVCGPRLDSQRTLSYGWYEFHRVHIHRNPVLPAHTLETGRSKYDCVESSLIKFSEARIQIPAKIADCKIGAHGPYLRPPAEAAGADDRSMTQIVDCLAFSDNQGVARVVALRNGDYLETGGQNRGNVFHAVDRHVSRPVRQGVLYFLDEKPLAANLCQRNVGNFVTCCLYDYNFKPDFRPELLQGRFYDPALLKSQHTAAGRNPDQFLCQKCFLF